MLFLLERPQQGDDMGLHGDVQRGRGFIEDDELRLESERPGDGHALALAAGHMVRVAAGEILRQIDEAEQLPRLSRYVPGADQSEIQKGLAEDVLDAELRVERGGRVLKDHLDRAPVLAERLAGEAGHVLPAEEDAPCGGLLETGQDAGERRFP